MPLLAHEIFIRWWDRFSSHIQIPNFHLPPIPVASPSLSASIIQIPPPQTLEQQNAKGKSKLVSESTNNPSQSPPFTPPKGFYANQFAILHAIQSNDAFLETPYFEDSQDPYDYSSYDLDDILPLPQAKPYIFRGPPVIPSPVSPVILPVVPTVVPTTACPIVVPTPGPTGTPSVAPPLGGPRALGPPHVSRDVIPAESAGYPVTLPLLPVTSSIINIR